MAKGVVPMDVRLRIALGSDGLNVAEFCRDYRVSRQTFYVWRRRYQAEGLAGLEARSRAARSHPGWVGPEVEEAIIGLRKDLAGAGLDAGPGTIQWHLGRQAAQSGRVPSQATIWRVLTRRGFVVPEPRKRPTASWRRFEATAPNELWQADFTDWAYAGGVAKILSFLDDHSRVALRVRALPAATTQATWDTFCEATAGWGVPLGQLTDNGVNFSGKLRGFEVYFEAQLRAAGVVPKTSRPYHPQTCGKVERFQQTMKKWLRRQRLAATLDDLQTQLDAFIDIYNHHRPHRGIGRVTPAQRWAATPPAINLGVALPGPAQQSQAVVSAAGVLEVSRTLRIGLGKARAGQHAIIHYDDTHAAVYIDHRLIRALVIDHRAPYQPIEKPHPKTPKG